SGIRCAGVRGAISHVEFQGQHALGRTELGGRVREMVGADVRDDDIHPCAEQGLGNAEPDAACAPRYECGFAWQVLHAAVLLESSAAARRRGRTKRWTNRRKSYCIEHIQSGGESYGRGGTRGDR